MIRFLSLFLLSFILIVPSVYAQEDAVQDESTAEEQSPIKDINADDNYEQRLTLARQMHEIWPIRVKVESALERLAQQIEGPQRLRFKAAMRQAIKFEALEQASVDAMTDIYSAKELEAMIAFYGSKEGRSASYKTSDYESALEPLLVKMIDKAILETKLGAPQ